MVVDPIELGVVVVQDYGSCFCLFEGGGEGESETMTGAEVNRA